MQRLTEARWRGTRAREAATSRMSVHPDGTPAPLPFSAGGVRRLAGSARQRFSGSGVASHTAVERQERRARSMTFAMAGMSAILILGSAFVLFNPFVQRIGFGFAPGLHTRILNSGQVIFISNGSPTPTAAGATPTPTPTPTRASDATPTRAPTAAPTAVPTATPPPQPTATPVYGPATVTFYRTANPLTISQTMTACTGCSLSAGGGTIPAATNSYNDQVPYGSYAANAQTVQTSPGTQEVMWLTFFCIVDSSAYRGCRTQNPTSNWTDVSGNHNTCTVNQYVGMGRNTSRTLQCTVTVVGHFNFYDYLSADGGTVWSGCPDPSNGGANSCFITVTANSVDIYGTNPTYATTYYMPSSSTCMGQGGSGTNVQNNARNAANNSVNSGPPNSISGSLNFPQQYFCSDQNSCNPVSAGSQMPGNHSQYSQCQSVSAYRFAYTATDAHTLQGQRLGSAVQQYYVLDPATSVCSAGSVVPGTENGNHTSVQISCAASGRELYDWNYNNGQFQQQLKQALAGETISQALATLRQTAGVNTSMTMQICTSVNGASVCSTTGGSQQLPSTFSAISLVIQTP